MQPHEVNMDLVLEASRVWCECGHCHHGGRGVSDNCDDMLRTIIAAVYDSIYQAGYGFGYTDGFVDKGDLEGA